MLNQNHIKVFQLDDIEWWAGESLEACLAEARRQCGPDCYLESSDQHEVSAEAMERLQFIDDDGTTRRSFAAELARRVAAGEQFPQPFAAEEW
jgi:hypothetical protein